MMFPIQSSPDDTGHLEVVRGVTPAAFLVHPQVRVTEGYLPRSGQDEVLVGSRAAVTLSGDDTTAGVGERLWFDGRPWTISGRFEAPGADVTARR